MRGELRLSEMLGKKTKQAAFTQIPSVSLAYAPIPRKEIKPVSSELKPAQEKIFSPFCCKKEEGRWGKRRKPHQNAQANKPKDTHQHGIVNQSL